MIHNATQRRRHKWTFLVHLYADLFHLDPEHLDTHAAEYHYTGEGNLAVVIEEAGDCLIHSGGDVHACV